MVYTTNEIVIPVKFILIILQFVLLVGILATKDEYIFVGIPKFSKITDQQFLDAESEILALTWLTIILLVSQLVTLSLGISVMFEKINVFQVLLHFVGVNHLILMILDRYSYTQMRSILFFYAFIPFMLEVIVSLFACKKINIINKRLQLLREQRDAARQRAIQKEEEKVKKTI